MLMNLLEETAKRPQRWPFRLNSIVYKHGMVAPDLYNNLVPLESQPRLQRSIGSGSLTVKLGDGRTRIDNLHQQGCSKIRLPRVHDVSGTTVPAQVVLINSSGGMTGGDKLNWQFGLGSGTHLAITTQACERIYKSSSGEAQTHIAIEAGDDTSLAWLPQETILYDQSRFVRTMEADLSKSCEALFVEPVIFGRKAMHEVVEDGMFHDRWRIHHGGKLVHAEDFHVDGNINKALSNNSVANGNFALATMLLIAPRAEGLLNVVRQHIGLSGDVQGDASFWNEKLLVRLLAPTSLMLRQKLIPLIGLLNNGASLPRSWAT